MSGFGLKAKAAITFCLQKKPKNLPEKGYHMIHGTQLKMCPTAPMVLMGPVWARDFDLVKAAPALLFSDVCGSLPLGEVRVKHSCWSQVVFILLWSMVGR